MLRDTILETRRWHKPWRAGELAALVALALAMPIVASAETRSHSTRSNSTTADTTAPGETKEKKLRPAEALAKADALVKEALHYEIYGVAADRDRLLAEARAVVPHYAPAMWHSGYVRSRNGWMNFDDVQKFSKNDARLQQYVTKRNEASDTLVGHLQLARWCESRGLGEQAFAHFSNVLDFNPNHAEARAKLGFRRIDGKWVSAADIQRHQAQAEHLQTALQTWQPRIIEIRNGFLSNSEEDRKLAEQRLAKVDDVAAVAVVERILSLVSEQCATAVVSWTAQWNQPEASHSLALQSVFSPWESVRSVAAEKLRDRPLEDYVPEMLAAIRYPVQIRNVSFVDRNGWIVNRDIFIREGRNQWEVLALDTRYGRAELEQGQVLPRSRSVSLSCDNSREAINRFALAARNDLAMRRTATEMATALQNAQTEELTDRITASLAIATGQRAMTSPNDWWNWWNQENEVQAVTQKVVAGGRLQKDVVLLNREDNPYEHTKKQVTTEWYVPPPPTATSCFAAGTVVWTQRGGTAIEKMRVGDVVLSQDVESGQLALKPVIRTTRREPVPTFTIETDDGSLRATGGHLFWVAGEGWTKARHLRSGQTLHCATGTAQVSDVAETAAEPTYNLVVADFNTYFVGQQRILTHDVTDRKPSRAIVPGLLRE